MPAVNPFAGAPFESAVASILGMGFPEPDVRVALMAAFGNPDRAVDYLMSGIPPGAMAQVNAMAARPAAGPSSSGPAPTAGGPLAALRSHAQFEEMKRLMQSDPTRLNSVRASPSPASARSPH